MTGPIPNQLVMHFQGEAHPIGTDIIAAERLQRLLPLDLAADGIAARFALVLSDKIPDVPVQDLVLRDAQQVAFGLIYTGDDPIPIDFVVGDRRLLEQRPKPAFTLAQAVVRA